MRELEDLLCEFNQLTGQMSPISHRVAAEHLHSMADIACSVDERRRVYQAACVWLKTLSSIINMGKKMSEQELYTVIMLRKDMGDKGGRTPRPTTPPTSDTGTVCDDCEEDDGFFDDLPFDKPAPKGKVRPSRVPKPGPLGPTLDKIRALESEDELRAWCIFGEEMREDGRIPRGRLVICKSITASNDAIVRLYRERRIQRSWTTPVVWDVDTALVEDVFLLKILVNGEYKSERIAYEAYHMLPYMRRLNGIQLGFAFTEAHRKFRKAKMIGRCKAGTYELTVGWEDKLRPTLLAAWEQAKDPDKDGGIPSPAPTGANP